MKPFYILFLFLFIGKLGFSQKDTAKFDRKKEIIYDNKRYRVYNTWISAGGGFSYNSRWPKDEKNSAVDISFNIRKQNFRMGAFASGEDFKLINNYNLHFCYGYRKETNKYNLSAFIGPSYSYFKRPLKDSLDYDLTKAYDAAGAFGVIEAVYKLKYDIGVGAQLFCDYNPKQTVYGMRFIVYFSGAYRGYRLGYRGPKK